VLFLSKLLIVEEDKVFSIQLKNAIDFTSLLLGSKTILFLSKDYKVRSAELQTQALEVSSATFSGQVTAAKISDKLNVLIVTTMQQGERNRGFVPA